MGRRLAGDGEEAGRSGKPEPADAPCGNSCGRPEQLKMKKKKRRSKDKHAIAAEETETRTVEAAQRNGTREDDEGREIKKKKNREEVGEGGGRNLENGGEVGKKKKRKKVAGGVAWENGGDEKSGGSEEEDVVEAKGVTMSGKNAKDAKCAALNTFSESGLPAEVLDCCKKFSKPSSIQSHAWLFLLDGRDFVGIAATGSGSSVPCARAAPTRELAQQ
ncbi:hypothetical protein Taro_015843, partial [Colocasia esculenta]|nr:hypothetical protein [Colocasia esculenta]